MEEISKQTAIRAYVKNFGFKTEDHARENLLKAYKNGKAYVLIFKQKKDVHFLIFGTDNKTKTDQQICLDMDGFRAIQKLDVDSLEILFKGANNGNEKNI